MYQAVIVGLLSFLCISISTSNLIAQSNWPCPRCSLQVYVPDTNSAPYTVFIQEPNTKCLLSVSYRNVLCESNPPCAVMYLESVSAVNSCCDLDDLQLDLMEIIDFVTRYALLSDPVVFSLGNDGSCARVYRKRCWSRTNILAIGCATEACCFAERIGTNVVYELMPLPDPSCQDLQGCSYICKP